MQMQSCWRRVLGLLWHALSLEVRRRSDYHQARRARQADVDHVAIDRLDEPHAGVELAGHGVHEAVVDMDLHAHLRVARDEAWEEIREDHRDRCAGYAEAHAARHLASPGPHGLQRLERLIDGRSGVVEQAMAGVGQGDTPRGARQQRDPEPLLELSDRLAERRRRHAEVSRRRRVAEAPSDDDEGVKGVERCGGHREGSLHGSSAQSQRHMFERTSAFF